MNNLASGPAYTNGASFEVAPHSCPDNFLRVASGLADIAVHPQRQLQIAANIGRGVFGHPARHNRKPKTVVLSHKGREHMYLVTEPVGVDSSTAVNTIFLPGLTEMADTGSAYRLHTTYADYHSDRRVITSATEGVSHTGKLRFRSPDEIRLLEHVAADNLELLPELTEDGPVELSGTSRGTKLAMHIAEQNMAANPKDMLYIERIKLIASAVIACNVPESESFLKHQVNEEEMRSELTRRFLLHVGNDLFRMAVHHPSEILSCSPVLGAYALYPHKAPSRLKAIIADFRDVQRGVDWKVINEIARQHKIIVLGGEFDPLTQWQIPQWAALAKKYPHNVQQKIVPGKGHLLTANALATVQALADMETQPDEMLMAA